MVDTGPVPTLRVALLQLTAAAADAAENLDRGLTACSIASAGGADIALFPEMWQIGYTPCPDDADGRRGWANRAVETDGDWLGNFRRIAVELDMAVVITYLQRWRGAPRNAATLIDRTGQPVATYAKVHTCDFAMEAALTPGDAFRVADLATAHGKVRIGMMICFDREYPESARGLMLEGAEVILTPNACELTEDRIGQFRARAFENMVAVAMANYPAPQFNGRSCARSTELPSSRTGPIATTGSSRQGLIPALSSRTSTLSFSGSTASTKSGRTHIESRTPTERSSPARPESPSAAQTPDGLDRTHSCRVRDSSPAARVPERSLVRERGSSGCAQLGAKSKRSPLGVAEQRLETRRSGLDDITNELVRRALQAGEHREDGHLLGERGSGHRPHLARRLSALEPPDGDTGMERGAGRRERT